MEEKIEKGKKKYKVKFIKVKRYFELDDDKWNKLTEEEKKQKIAEYNKENNIKTHYLSFRINDQDYEFIKNLIDNKNIKKSDILYYFIHDITRNDRKKLIEDIKKQGININQIAKHCNQKNDKPEMEELIKINEKLKEILDAI